MKFLKFEFANEAEWLTVKDSPYCVIAYEDLSE
jgi:hypothetical protein